MPELILVTGASSDIGDELVRSLLYKDGEVKVIAHSFQGGARIQSLVEEFGERVQPVIADFSKAASVGAMAEEIAAKFGVPTQIVHLPAMRISYARLPKFNLDKFRLDMAIQVESAVVLLMQFAPKMSKMPAARMVFVLSSVIHGMPPSFMSMYTVAKYAQLGLMRAAAAEYASTGFTINAVSPSMIETQFVQEIGDVAVRISAAANPKGRNGVPSDVLGVIRFLLSPEASFMTGVDIPITGGNSC